MTTEGDKCWKKRSFGLKSLDIVCINCFMPLDFIRILNVVSFLVWWWSWLVLIMGQNCWVADLCPNEATKTWMIELWLLMLLESCVEKQSIVLSCGDVFLLAGVTRILSCYIEYTCCNICTIFMVFSRLEWPITCNYICVNCSCDSICVVRLDFGFLSCFGIVGVLCGEVYPPLTHGNMAWRQTLLWY